MFTVSLHKVKIFAPVGLYPQEWILGNRFEVDIDVYHDSAAFKEGTFVDYTVLNDLIQESFTTDEQVLEQLVQKIHRLVFEAFPFIRKVKVSLRKMNPPMAGDMAYAQVSFEA